jgi:hypothetical protein
MSLKCRALVALQCLLWATSSFADVPASERDVLLALYNDTHGDNWGVQWDVSTPVCPGDSKDNWAGIACDSNNSTVVGIVLDENNLVGPLPSLDNLPNLTTLVLFINQLSGPIPSLQKLHQLQSISLGSNKFTGKIPEISGLTNLEYFEVFGNALSGTIPSVSGLNQLIDFDVGYNNLEGTIPSLSGMTSLVTFDVTSNHLVGSLPALVGMSHLQKFGAAKNELTGAIPPLLELSDLEQFSVYNNRLVGSIPALPSQLKLLSVEQNALEGIVPVVPTNMYLGNSGLCPNLLSHTVSTGWDIATGVTPWYSTCTTIASATTIVQVSPNPADVGATVRIDIQVASTVGASPAAPTGSVTVNDNSAGTNACVDVPLTGDLARCELAFASSGDHVLTISYSGDAIYAPSSSATTVLVASASTSDAPALSRFALEALILALTSIAFWQRCRRRK